MSLRSPATSDYVNAQSLINFFHSFPHYDLSFKPVPSRFNPESHTYLETISIIGVVPVLWMVIWICIYLVYFCYFCLPCRKERVEKQQKRSRSGKWASFIFAVLSLLILTASIYGNDMMANSVSSAGRNVKQIDQDFVNISKSVVNIQQNAATLRSTLTTHALNTASTTARRSWENKITRVGDILSNTSQMLDREISKIFNAIVLGPSPPYQATLEKYTVYELYRRLASYGICAFVMICLLLTMCSVGTKRKGFILTCMVFVMFSAMVMWLSVGFYSAVTVATADYCYNPEDPQLPTLDDPSDSVTDEIFAYYTECSSSISPFVPAIQQAQQQVMEAQRLLLEVKESGSINGQVDSYITDVTGLLHEVVSLGASLDCTYIHRSYVSAHNDVCTSTILAETVVLCGFLLSGIFLLILVFALHNASRHAGNKRAYVEVDSNDQFVGREASNRSDNPLYYRFSQMSAGEAIVSQANISASAPPPQRSSPPPAYQHPSDFWSTYGNNASLEANNVTENDLNRDSNSFRQDE